MDDRQLVARGHFVEVDYPALGRVTIESSRVRLLRTPPRVTFVPGWGEHTAPVVKELLAMPDEAIAEAAAAGVLA